MAAAPRGPDSAIKLFGRTIAVLDSDDAAAEGITKLADGIRSNSGTKCIPNKLLNVKLSSFCSKNSSLNGKPSVNSPNEKMEIDPKPEEFKTESDGSGQEKEFKRPDKILPCPRCSSMETKFCYFNNYNVNQPRHFCRSCKRYWTAGGTMRNVPIGAGRRRNKHPSHHRHAMVSSDGNVSNGNASDTTNQQSLPVEPRVLQREVGENERVTKSGSDASFCKSKAPVLNTKEKNNSLGSVDNKEEKSCATSSTASGCSENWMPENAATKEQNNFLGTSSCVKETHPHIQSYPAGPALVAPWSPGWNRGTDMRSTNCSTNGTTSKVSLPLPIMMPAPGLSAAAVPLLVPPLWRGNPVWPNGMWPGRIANNANTLPSPPNSSGSNSSKLGKHSREEILPGEKGKGNNICIPKILRITDPEDTAKSSILSSLGIKPEDKSIFKPFRSEVLEGCKTPEPQAQQANPAAVSRSQSFQERT